MSEPVPLPPDAPPEDARRRILLGLGLGLLAQMIVPLTYYLRDDRYDERFAWRMFSATRVEACETRALESGGDGAERPIDLSRAVHAAWSTHMERHRRSVIDRFLEMRCALGARAARVVNVCEDARGEARPEVVYAIDCASGKVTVRGR